MVERLFPGHFFELIVDIFRINGEWPRPAVLRNSSCSKIPFTHSLPRLTSASATPRDATGSPVFIEPDFDRAAGGTITTGGVFPFHHALVGNLDRIFLFTTKQHDDVSTLPLRMSGRCKRYRFQLWWEKLRYNHDRAPVLHRWPDQSSSCVTDRSPNCHAQCPATMGPVYAGRRLHCKHLIGGGAKHRDFFIVGQHHACAQHRNIFQCRDFCPFVHFFLNSTS